MKNSEMKAGRFAKWAKARRRLAAINAAFDAGRTVQVVTSMRVTNYAPKHRAMFVATRSGLFVQSGKKFLCLDFTTIKAA